MAPYNVKKGVNHGQNLPLPRGHTHITGHMAYTDYYFKRSIMEVALEKESGIYGEEYRVLIS
jgi:hypothetical protein